MAVERITRRPDYLAANRGRRFVTPGFILIAHIRRDAHAQAGPRIGLTVSKKVGNAVVRNRVKRRFRALAREILPTHAQPGTDYVMIGRKDAFALPFATLRADLTRGLRKLSP